MRIDKGRVVEALRSRGLDGRADWVDRTLPDPIDTRANAGVLATLGLDPADFADQPETVDDETG